MVKRRRTKLNAIENARHSLEQETPFPLYLGLMVHCKTRKKGLVEILAKQGVSVSYDRVQSIQLAVTKQLCADYQGKGVVCPTYLKEGLFTTSAIDNIDHNPSSTTATESFHGTTISVFQHPATEMTVALPELKKDIADSRTELRLPESYTSLPPTKAAIAEYPLQSVNHSHFGCTNPLAEANEWLTHLETLTDADSNVNIAQHMSWSGFHSQNAANVTPVKTLSTLLPLLKDSVNSTSMVRHTMDIIKQILLLINPKQAAVITADQPVYTLGKQIQWMYPDLYGEDKLLMMMGGLHIEMAFLDAIGDWLEGSGWVEVLVKAEVNTPGRAESFLSGKQVKRSRYAHQVSCAGLHLLLQDAFVRDGSDLPLEQWISAKVETSIQFKYWYTVVELEATLLLLVQSIRQSNFIMFISALEQLVPWMFALDHTNYARWLPIFIADLQQLPAKHPQIYDE
eukprot:Seg731.3 transcript_id=Seg731.3/GoldUCD/mRNA.D3Y31 product="hypothetical protein" protein_id=Seg731.3/GoldUCD/D3Y31